MNSTRPAQPSQSKFPHVTSGLYLRPAILHKIQKADKEPHDKKRFALLEWARDNSRQLRQRHEGGKVRWWPVWFAVGICLFLVYLARQQSLREFTYSAPDDIFQILVRHDAHHYEFNHIHSEYGSVKYAERKRAAFCPDYGPDLSAGQTLVRLHYMDFGACWSIQPKGYGYTLETKDGIHPTLAPNCFVTAENMTDCKPNHMEAIF